jgi:Tfp pilus assembly protein PilF
MSYAMSLAAVGRRSPGPAVSAASAGLRRLLLGVALLAASRRENAAVAAIKPALVAMGIEAGRFDVTVATVLLRSGDAAACLAWLEREVLNRDPNHELALAVQACAWKAQGRSEWRQQANALLATSANPLVREIARVPL